jgi:hypothetical protein
VLVGENQKLESAAQAVAITRHGAQLHEVRRKWDGKLQGNNFAGLYLAAEGGPDAILAEFVGSAPAGAGLAFPEDRYLNAHVKTITGETPQAPLCLCCCLCLVAQRRFSISSSLSNPGVAEAYECGQGGSYLRRLCESIGPKSPCLEIVLHREGRPQGIKGHVPTK